ncbi:MAG: calcium-binding protein [Paracoccus sp. (in: a-proteobacteria)]|nr:calcium-binding protein [Paracoccus sp. (in: a-proteobacteria)]
MFIIAGILGALTAGALFGLLDGDDGLDEDGGESPDEAPQLPRADQEGGLLPWVGGVQAGGFGDDLMIGSDGADDLAGGGGNDLIFGLGGNDWLFGDDAPGEAGDDTIYGGAGDDTLVGNGGDDLMVGGPGQDRLFGGDGDDTLAGGPGDDWLEGGAGDDLLFGGPGDDDLSGGPGDDTLIGGAGVDSLHGGAGNDLLIGGAGDWLDGNEGDDRFVILHDGSGPPACITDFSEGDRIEIVAAAEAVMRVIHDTDGTAMVLIDDHPVLHVLDAAGLRAADILLLREGDITLPEAPGDLTPADLGLSDPGIN